MNKQQAEALSRLSSNEDFTHFSDLVRNYLDGIAEKKLRVLTDPTDIYRMQGECRGYQKVFLLLEEAQDALLNGTDGKAKTVRF